MTTTPAGLPVAEAAAPAIAAGTPARWRLRLPPPPTPPADGSETQRVLRIEARAVILAKGGALVNVAIALVSYVPRYPLRPGPLRLAVAVMLETIAFCALTARRGRIVAWAVACDTVVGATGLLLNGALQSVGLLHNWGLYMYPFTLVSTVVTGVGFRRLPVATAWTAVLWLGYVLCGTLLVGDPAWNVVPNSVSYLAIGPIVWAVDAELRRSAHQADAYRAEAVANAALAARERERNRHQRMLHDRVLQTLEMLARGSWVTDSAVQARIAEEAVWLRALVDGADPDAPADLASALSAVVQRQARDGLRVDVLDAELRTMPPDSPVRRLPGEALEALLGATYEALTNVRKHSGVSRASLRVEVEADVLVISVLDHGRGFDPAVRHAGLGLTGSIRARMREAGGEALIESAPGDGTYVELRLPVGAPG